MRRHVVTGGGGVPLAVRDVGPEGGAPILFLHGWSQHSLSWSKQMGGLLAREFRLVAPDLRGHGASGKPDDPAAYRASRLWAEDVAAVIDTLGLDRPLVVGWSMGGWVVQDYLRHFGGEAVGGVVLTGAAPRIGRHADPDVMARRRPDARAEGMYAEDHEAQIEAVIGFLKACVAAPLSKHDLAFMVGFNMLVPPHVRHAARTRDEDWRADLARLTVPALVIQGAAERICFQPMFEEMVAALPGALGVTYPGCGHAPFWENPARFDDDLATFLRDARGVP